MARNGLEPEIHVAYDIRYLTAEKFEVVIKDNRLKDEFLSLISCSSLYDNPPTIDSNTLQSYLKTLKAKIQVLKEEETVKEEETEKGKEKEEKEEKEETEGEKEEKGKENDAKRAKKEFVVDPIVELVAFLEKKFAHYLEKSKTMVQDGKIVFDLLGFVFTKGEKVYAWELGSKYGGDITSASYVESFLGRYFSIQIHVIESNGENFYQTEKSISINGFEDIAELSLLPVQLMPDNVYEELKERGKLFQKYGLSHHFLHYKGNIIRKGWFVNRYRADGRVMVDGANFRRFNPDYRDLHTRNNAGMKVIPEAKLYMCWPTLKGFSFYAKKWGEIFVENLSDIVFEDKAFERLVLEEQTKSLLKAVILNSDETFSDIISGKGNGIIFLFHGAPGVGKTLTAEAIAELLHNPLYMVSVGEMGTDATTLEKNLREILEVSRSWNAVVLIDEADIFLEKRTENDIKRNAMVGVFLRMLEYHQGILILTTNRVRSFDAAFYSRITLALKYESLDNQARTEVWLNLLSAANVTITKAHELNGRQIKNTIKLAQALAINEKSPLKTSHFETGIKFSTQFSLDTK